MKKKKKKKKGHDTIQKLIVLFEFFWVKKWKEKKNDSKKIELKKIFSIEKVYMNICVEGFIYPLLYSKIWFIIIHISYYIYILKNINIIIILFKNKYD